MKQVEAIDSGNMREQRDLFYSVMKQARPQRHFFGLLAQQFKPGGTALQLKPGGLAHIQRLGRSLLQGERGWPLREGNHKQVGLECRGSGKC